MSSQLFYCIIKLMPFCTVESIQATFDYAKVLDFQFITSCCVVCNATQKTMQYYINITFPERVIVENIIPRNMLIKPRRYHIWRDDIFDYHPLRECNTYFIISNKTLDPLFSTACFLLDLPW